MSKHKFILVCAAVAACAAGARAQTVYYLTPNAPTIPFGSGVAAGLAVAPNSSGGFVTSPVGSAALATGAAAANLGFTPLSPANNLSDLSNASTARTNLGLGALSTTTPGSGVPAALGAAANGSGGVVTSPVANANLATGAAAANLGFTPLNQAKNLSDLQNPSIARSNLGICINPLAYGAAGNGVTDDTAAVQNAINASVAAGVPVCITKLHYISSGLTSSGNPVDIEGFAPVGNDGVSNAQNCLSGLITNSNITMLYLTNSKVTMRNLCEQASTAINASVPSLTKGFPMVGHCASPDGWKTMQASGYLLRIRRGWKAGWRAGTRHRSWFGGRGSC